MKNAIQEGDVLKLTAPYAVLAGAGAKVGSVFGVSVSDVANGAEGSFNVEGVFELAKADSQAWTQGVKVYWDDAAKNVTTTAATNTLIGVAILPVAATAGLVLGKVRLNGSF